MHFGKDGKLYAAIGEIPVNDVGQVPGKKLTMRLLAEKNLNGLQQEYL